MSALDRFDKPQAVTKLDLAFGGNMNELLPSYQSIPEEYRNGATEWNAVTDRWFYKGLPEGTFLISNDGINAEEAANHIQAILVSYDPKHEHKMAGCAYLLSKWFTRIEFPKQSTK